MPSSREVGRQKVGTHMKRTRLSPVSAKRRKANAERKANLEQAFGPKPWSCRFRSFVPSHSGWSSVLDTTCYGPVDGHEILKRSRSRRDENLTDPSGIVPLCQFHNGWVEDHGDLAELLGLSIPSGPPVKSIVNYPKGEA